MRWRWLALARAKGSAVERADLGGFEVLKVCWEGCGLPDEYDELQGRSIDGEGKARWVIGGRWWGWTRTEEARPLFATAHQVMEETLRHRKLALIN
jgi:hypothetical protein